MGVVANVIVLGAVLFVSVMDVDTFDAAVDSTVFDSVAWLMLVVVCAAKHGVLASMTTTNIRSQAAPFGMRERT